MTSKKNYTKPAELCVFTNKGSNPRMTKLFTMMDGIFKKNGSSQMFVGTCEKKEITSLDELHALMNGLSSDQALTYGIPKDGKAMQEVGMVPWAKANGGFARGKDFMEFSKGKPGIMYIDHDPSPDGRSVTADELAKLLGEIDPAFADVQMLSRSSSSNGIYNGKELMTTHAGTHLYIMVDDASRIPEMMAMIHRKAWLHGYGHIALSEVGSLLERSVFDAAVSQAERLDYAAAPRLLEPLTRSETKPKAMNKNGSAMLKTAAVMPLTNDEVYRFEDLVNAAKTKIEPKAAKVRKKRIKQKVDEQCGPGASRKEKEKARNAFVLALDYKILDSGFIITANDGKKTTVSSVCKTLAV